MSKNYSAIIDMIEEVSKLSTYPVKFGWGEISDMNPYNKDKTKTVAWLLPLNEADEFINEYRLQKTYSLTFYFYQSDKADSNNEQRLTVIQDCDDIVTEFLLNFNKYIYELPDADKRNVILSNINKVCFFKQTVHVLTGIELTFKLKVPDDFEFCP